MNQNKPRCGCGKREVCSSCSQNTTQTTNYHQASYIPTTITTSTVNHFQPTLDDVENIIVELIYNKIVLWKLNEANISDEEEDIETLLALLQKTRDVNNY